MEYIFKGVILFSVLSSIVALNVALILCAILGALVALVLFHRFVRDNLAVGAVLVLVGLALPFVYFLVIQIDTPTYGHKLQSFFMSFSTVATFAWFIRLKFAHWLKVEAKHRGRMH